MDVQITGISLRTPSAGIYYSATVNAHSAVAKDLTCGIAVKLDSAPGASFRDNSLYTAQSGDTGSINGVLINEILKEGAVEKSRADSVIHAIAYVEYAGQTIISESKGYSLTGLMGLMNEKFNGFELAQKKMIKNFYDKYATEVDWNLAAIADYVVPAVE